VYDILQVSRMRSDFFQQKPTDVRNTSDRLVEKMEIGNMFYDSSDGTKVFRVCFDVGQFSAEEIELKTHDQRLSVHAVHHQTGRALLNISRSVYGHLYVCSLITQEREGRLSRNF